MSQTELAKFFAKRKLGDFPVLNYFLSFPQINLACCGAIESIKGVSALERYVRPISWFLLLHSLRFLCTSKI